MPPRARTAAGRAAAYATPAGLWLALVGAALAGPNATATYAPAHAALLAALYALLALALWAGAALLARWGWGAGLVAAAGLAFVVFFHLREQTRWPASIFAVPVLALLAAPLLGRLALRPSPGLPGARRLAAALIAATAGFTALFAALWTASPVARWHLLRHNTLLGTPAWYLFATPVEERRRRLFAARDLLAAPPGGAAPPAAAPAADPSAGAAAAAAGPTGGDLPHVVFVLLDTLRADALAGWGGEPGRMPALDAFLAAAWRFTDVWANATWTRPSVGSFFTGLLQEEHGARDAGDGLAEARVTVAEVLRGRGYATTAFVTNLAAVGRDAGFAQGFDQFFELPGRPYARAEAVVRGVERWLDETPAGGPRFLYLHFLDPHEPYLAGGAPRAPRRDAYLAAYRRELAYLDGQLARLLPLLRDRLGGRVVFLVASDHGEEFFEHGLFGHGRSLYREVLWVPVALWTGDGGGEVAAPLEGRDLFDLLLAVAAPEAPHPPAWAAGRARPTRYASLYYSTAGRLALRPYLRHVCMRAVERGGEKLVGSAYGDTVELYDLAADPAERRNLAGRRPGRAAALAAALDDAVAFWVAPGPLALSEETREQMRALGYLD